MASVCLLVLLTFLIQSTNCQVLLAGKENGCNRDENLINRNQIYNSVEEMEKEIEKVRTEVLDNLVDSNPEDYSGGIGGLSFSDYKNWKGKAISAINLTCSDRCVFSIQVKYGDLWARKHGDICPHELLFGGENIFQYETFHFDKSEYITGIESSFGWVVNSITIHTKKRSLPRCGPDIGTKKVINGTKLLFISGRAFCLLDGLQPNWLEEVFVTF